MSTQPEEALRALTAQATVKPINLESVREMLKAIAGLRANKARQELLFKELEHSVVHELARTGAISATRAPIPSARKACATCALRFQPHEDFLEFEGRFWHLNRCV